jgi:hypothetical protein
LRARLAKEGDVARFEYDYFSENGVPGWFTLGGKANMEMLKLLSRLKDFFSNQISLVAGLRGTPLFFIGRGHRKIFRRILL